jgi:molybdopterin-guanine dinucleotide biosynthesis protein A
MAAYRPDLEWMVSVPGDCPFLPVDLVARLHEAREQARTPLACAKSGNWRHPVAGLWNVKLRAELRHAMIDEDLHKIEIWTGRHGIAIAEWPDRPVDPFFNVNTPEERERANAIANSSQPVRTA